VKAAGHTPAPHQKEISLREERGFYLKESGERGFCNNNKRKKKARERMKLEEKYITFEVVVVVADHRFQSTYFSRLTRRQLLLAVAESTSLN